MARTTIARKTAHPSVNTVTIDLGDRHIMAQHPTEPQTTQQQSYQSAHQRKNHH